MPKGWMFNNFISGNKLSLDAGNPLSYPGTGISWYDLSGSNNNGTLVNGVSWNGRYMVFDGVDDYVIPSIAITCKTVSLWINLNEVISTSKYFIGFIGGSLEGGGIRYNGSTFIVYLGNGTSGLISVPWTKTNIMVNLLFIDKTGGYWDVYANSSFIGTSYSLGQNSGVANRIGTRSDQPQLSFKGEINDVNIYDYALTSQQISDTFNALRGKYGI